MPGAGRLAPVDLGQSAELLQTTDETTGATTETAVAEPTTAAEPAPQYDPATGLEIDPATGLLIDPATGYLLDLVNGRIIDPRTGYLVHPMTGLLIDPVTGAQLDPVTLAIVIPAGFGSDTPEYVPGSDSMRGSIETVVDDTYDNATYKVIPPTDGPTQPVDEIVVPTEVGRGTRDFLANRGSESRELAAAAALRVAVCASLRYPELAPAPVRTYVNEVDDRPAFRFGRTIVSVAVGDLLGQEAEVIVVAANRRGVLGPLATPGLSGLRSLGGSEIEREAMSLAPLELGTAVMTGASGLEERGIRAVVHAVIHPALGERARIEDVRRAVPAALTAASQSRLRTVAMPLLGVESLAAKADVDAMVAAVVDELVGSLRRAIPRLDRLTIVCRFDEHADTVEAALAKARERVWTRVP